MATSTIQSDLTVNGAVVASSLSCSTASITGAMIAPTAAIGRSKLAQDTNQPFVVSLTDCRVHDAVASLLPASAGTDDLGLDTGTFGTQAPHLTAGDLKAVGATTRYARIPTLRLPVEYDAAETLTVRLSAKMETTVADTSCVVDVEAYKVGSDLTVGSDLVTTASQSMNSLTAANYDFLLNSSGLAAGDALDVRITITCTDAATGTAVEPVISKISLLADVKG